jgi:hypothetical protein
MFTKNFIPTSKRSLAVLLLPLFALLIIACGGPPADSEWVVHEWDTSKPPSNIYFVIDTRYQAGYDEEVDPEGNATDCFVLAFDKQSTTDPHGKNHYSAMGRGPLDAYWSECSEYSAVDKPPLVINSIPPEFADQMGIELPDLSFMR